jgi:hypothetical protein
MSDTLAYILEKFKPELGRHFPCKLHASRWGGLTGLFAELGFKTGAEIGVEQGKFSESLCRANPGVWLACIDPWQTYTRYLDHVSQPKLDGFYHEALARLAPFGCEIIRKYSMEAVRQFEPLSLDFVYIDGNHEFEYVVNDIIEWSKVVRPGGIVSGHDYRRDKADRIPFHVIQATQAYADAYKITPWFIFTKDSASSWMWVKP